MTPNPPKTRTIYRTSAVRSLESRSPLDQSGKSITNAVERYLALVQAYRPAFTQEEWGVIFQAGPAVRQASKPSILAAEVQDAVHEGLDQHWGIDGAELVRKLQALEPAPFWSVIEATEAFWTIANATDAAPEQIIPEVLRSILHKA